MTQKPSFGFGDIADFKPKAKPVPTKKKEAEVEAVDQVGQALGFKSRNETVERRKRKKVVKPVEQFNLRAHIEDINRFVAHAEKTNQSYREVFQELVKKLPKA